jgi:hypothetical protein
MSMDKKSIKYLERMYDILNAVPFGEAFKSSNPGIGALQYQNDMRELKPAFLHCLQCIAMSMQDVFAEDPYYSPEILLTAMEEWVELRKQENWQCRVGKSLQSILNEKL